MRERKEEGRERRDKSGERIHIGVLRQRWCIYF